MKYQIKSLTYLKWLKWSKYKIKWLKWWNPIDLLKKAGKRSHHDTITRADMSMFHLRHSPSYGYNSGVDNDSGQSSGEDPFKNPHQKPYSNASLKNPRIPTIEQNMVLTIYGVPDSIKHQTAMEMAVGTWITLININPALNPTEWRLNITLI